MKAQTARSFLRRLADKPIPNARTARRTACEIACYLFDANGLATAATILDRSAGGVRVKSSCLTAHSQALYLLRMDTGATYAVRLAWRAGPFAGFAFGERVDLRFRSRDNAVRATKIAWREHLEALERQPVNGSVDVPKVCT